MSSCKIAITNVPICMHGTQSIIEFQDHLDQSRMKIVMKPLQYIKVTRTVYCQTRDDIFPPGRIDSTTVEHVR